MQGSLIRGGYVPENSRFNRNTSNRDCFPEPAKLLLFRIKSNTKHFWHIL